MKTRELFMLLTVTYAAQQYKTELTVAFHGNVFNTILSFKRQSYLSGMPRLMWAG